jgi:hypothetical protein
MSFMPDVTADPQPSDADLVAEAACCPGGVCAPIFETSLVELVFKRIRLLAGRGTATQAVEVPSDPILDHLRSAGPSVLPSTARPHEVASHD